nr:uncharacterized protein LOC105885298 isoform X2 [Microcebus murinus]
MVAEDRSFPAFPANTFPRPLREGDSLYQPLSTAPWGRLDQSNSAKAQNRETHNFLSQYTKDNSGYCFLGSFFGLNIQPVILFYLCPLHNAPRHFGFFRSGLSNETAPFPGFHRRFLGYRLLWRSSTSGAQDIGGSCRVLPISLAACFYKIPRRLSRMLDQLAAYMILCMVNSASSMLHTEKIAVCVSRV